MKPEMSGEMQIQKLNIVATIKEHCLRALNSGSGFTFEQEACMILGAEKCFELMSAENARKEIANNESISAICAEIDRVSADFKQEIEQWQISRQLIQEKYDNAESDAMYLRITVIELEEREAKLKKKLERAVEALKYYGDRYEWSSHYFKMPLVKIRPREELDIPEEFLGWQKASEALKELEAE